MFYVSKLVQAFGMVQVSYGLVIGLSDADALGQELKMMVIGAGVFYLGRLMERWTSA